MKTNNSLTSAIIIFMVWLYFVVCWIVNLVQFTQCDFEESYREEIIKGIGVCGPAAGVTVWINE